MAIKMEVTAIDDWLIDDGMYFLVSHGNPWKLIILLFAWDGIQHIGCCGASVSICSFKSSVYLFAFKL